MAMIAGLPQAPSAINPINNPEAALKRRTHVLKRMVHYGFINEKEYQDAVDFPITANYHGRFVDFEALYVAEMARRKWLKNLVLMFIPPVIPFTRQWKADYKHWQMTLCKEDY